MRTLRMWSVAGLALVLAISLGHSSPAHAADVPPPTPVVARFFPDGAVPLARMADGDPGTGTILYAQHRDWDHPRLVVRLSKEGGARAALAMVYDAPSGLNYVPVSLRAGRVTVLPRLHPVITIRALGGWWLRSRKANYNLDVMIYGRVDATWGAANIPLFFPPLSRRPLQPTTPIFSIETRADPHGVPLWDMRTVIPEFSGYGYYRTNYAQRECSHPLQRVPSVSPLWPYVAFAGTFEQPAGKLVPPIAVNWRTGRAKMFSEVVTVREQTCSYDFYSLTRVDPGRVNTPDFESPWGLYDLSGRGKLYPNLIIRTMHFYPNDPYASTPRNNEVIRYSWADHPGNELFSYKVDVFGFHPYVTSTRIAGGRIRVVAPSYRRYPRWVISQRWPATTFVDATGSSALTSEGIYSWSSADIGQEYSAGQANTPDLRQFQSIPPGQRGEYRLGPARQAWLYASPIDLRLHLVDAQRGLWNLGAGTIVREGNIEGGDHIDEWQRVIRKRLSLPPGLRRANATVQLPPVTQAKIAFLHGFLLYSGSHGAVIQRTAVAPERFRVLPPTGKPSWRTFVAIAAPYRRGRNPRDFYSWLRALPGPALHVQGGHLSQIDSTSNGFRALVTVPSVPRRSVSRGQHRARRRGAAFGALPGLSPPPRPGRYILTYSVVAPHWAWRPAIHSHLRITVHLPTRAHAYLPTSASLSIRNDGTEDWHRPIDVSVDGEPLYAGDPWITGLRTWRGQFTWSPAQAGNASFVVATGSHILERRTLQVSATPRVSPALSFQITTPTPWTYPVVIAILLAALGLSWQLWRLIDAP